MNKYKLFNLVLVTAFVFSLGGISPTPVFAEESSPYIQAFPDEDRVNANNWPMDTVVTMTVNDSYTYISNVGQSSWDPNGTTAGFDIRDYGLKAGDTISMTGGGITRSMTVTALQIINIDVSTSTVSGTADADKQVYVWVNGAGGMWLTPNPDGTWTADFSPFSFVPGTEGGATQPDAAGNTTQTGWHTLTPVIQAFPDQDKVNANDWPIGTVVSMTINGSNAYTASAGASSWDPYGTTAEFWVEDHDVQAGDEIIITGAGLTRSMVVTSLQITDIDVNNAMVSGIADPDKTFHVWVNGGSDFFITPASDGRWTANFVPFVFVPGTNGGAQQTDEFGNYTQLDWRVPNLPNPALSVVPNDPNSGPGNIILGWDFEAGTTVNLCIDNPPFDSECDYPDSQIVPSEPNGFAGYQFQFNVDPSVFQIVSGQRVQLDNGLHTEEHIVTNMRLISVNWDTEQVSGMAEPGSEVEVPAVGDGRYIIRRVTANDDGNWTADYAHPGSAQDEQETLDLRLGHVFFIPEQWDENRNSTKFWWQPPNPSFSARITENEVHGYEWMFGSQVTLTIDDPNTTQEPDYTKTETVTFSDWDPNQTFVQFRLWENGFTLQPGMLVTMTDGSITKTHVTTDLVVLGADAETDTVWGTGTSATWVEVGHLCDTEGCAIRRTVIAADSTWLVDFSVPGGAEPDEQKTYDLQECESNETRQHDEDGDSTQYSWNTYCPPLIFAEQYTFNFGNTLIADPIIRQAIALGTDRQRILDQAFLPAEDYGQLLNVPMAPGHTYQAPASEITLYLYNPDDARTLLANAGWVDIDGDGIREKDGQELAFIFKTTINPMRSIAAQIFRENMETIGIRITVIQETPGTMFGENGSIVRCDFDIAEFSWSVLFEDGDSFDLYRSDNEQNYCGYDNSQYDAALDTYRSATTEEERSAAALLVQQIFTADLPAFYLFTRENIIPYQTPTGTSVTLTPLPEVTITYTNVSGEGVTAALAVNFNPADLPQNMQLVGSPYEIGTTAMFEEVKVCLAYRDNWLTPSQEAALRLYHYHNGMWLDVTDPGYPDTVNNLVCGTANDFSLFAVMYSLNQSPSADAGPDRIALAGDTITLDASGSSDPDNNIVTYAWDLDNDGQYDDATGLTTDITFMLEGVYNIGLKVTDSQGLFDTDTAQITVMPANPAFLLTLVDEMGNPLANYPADYPAETRNLKWKYRCGGSWVTETSFQTDANGKFLVTITCDNWDNKVTVTLNQTSKEQDVTVNPIFQAARVNANLKSCTGPVTDAPGGSVDQGGGYWYKHGDTGSTGTVSFYTFPGNIKVRMGYNHNSQTLSPTIAAGSNQVDFQTTSVTFNYADDIKSNKGGSWWYFDRPTMDLLPGDYDFWFKTGSTWYGPVTVSVSGCAVNSTFALLKVRDENGNGVSGGKATPACGGSWQSTLPGTTDENGNFFAQLPACTTKVKMTVNQGSVEQTNAQMAASNYTWHTEILRIWLNNHSGTPLTDRQALLSQGGGYWYTWGNLNASGYLDIPLFARSAAYKFKITYNYTSQELFPVVSVTPGIQDFAFQTGQVFGACITQYSAGAWRTFTSGMELMPGSYTFRYPSQSATVSAGGVTTLSCP